MHIGTLQLFSIPDDVGEGYVARAVEEMRSFGEVEPPFDRRIVTRYGQDFWDVDRYFDLDHHVRHASLPAPGRIRELLAYVSVEQSHLMDRERPLWEVHVIEGLADRKFAIYTKIHHAMMDGSAGMRLMRRVLSPDPAFRGCTPVWAVPRRAPRDDASARPSEAGSPLDVARASTNRLASTVGHFAREVRSSIVVNRKGIALRGSSDAPQCLLNEKITGSRRFAAQSFRIERFQDVATAFGCTLNDVVLAVCGGALREYLRSLRELPDESLVALVPVSLHDTEDRESGNEIALILASLGTDRADAAARLRAIVASVRDAKSRIASMTDEEKLAATGLSMMPAGFNILSGGRGPSPGFNVVISNMRGPKQTLYWNGAELDGVYPVAFLIDHVALNITLLSYRDHLEFGVTACRRTLPSIQRLLAYLESSLLDLERAAERTVVARREANP